MLVVLVAICTLTGCRQEDPPLAVFEPNLVHALKHSIKDGIPTEQASQDAMWVVTNMFGTPDEPKLPDVILDDEDLSSVISLDQLHKASGPDSTGPNRTGPDAAAHASAGRGLYRKHCASCHGITGNGRGPTAAIINPYPRDYRMGVFKFKSTKRSSKPTRDDLVKLISDGISGTTMKKIPELTPDDVQALTDYVIYLSIRGELERALIDDAVLELDLEGGDRVLDYQLGNWIKSESVERNPSQENPPDYQPPQYEPAQLVIGGQTIEEDLLSDFRDFKQDAVLLIADQTIEQELQDFEQLVTVYHEMTKPLEQSATDEEEEEPPTFAEKTEKLIEDFELYAESWEYAEDFVAEIVESWLEADDDVIEVPEPPADLPIAETYEEFAALSKGDQADALAASVKRGQEIFVGKIASCSKCHGEKGLGNGQTTDYDDWTKDWTSRAGLKPEEREKLIPLMARGALPPVNALPRNFAEGVFRGGGSSQALYRRIVAGIAGTPMPAATFVEGQYEQDDIWHMINFIRSLQTVPSESPQSTK